MGNVASDTLARQRAMLRLIPRFPRRITALELKSALESQGFSATRRTIERDLQNLSRQFGLVADESSKPYGWCWAKDARFEFAPRLTVSQSVALLLSRAHLHSFLPQTLLNELVPMFDVAEQELTSTGWKDWHLRTAVIPGAMTLLPPKLNSVVLEHVHSALALQRSLSGRYRSKGAKTAKDVTIHPLGLIVRGAVHYLVCTLFEYADIRQLALHRLSHTKVLATPSLHPEGFDFVSYASRATKYEPQGKIRLVVRFEARAAEHLRETPLSHDQQLKDLGDGQVELTATVESDETLRWWIRAFGSQVEVIDPPFLREEIRADLEKLLATYV
jgi:predicted DNA-binding transcriptional regulator YafY